MTKLQRYRADHRVVGGVEASPTGQYVKYEDIKHLLPCENAPIFDPWVKSNKNLHGPANTSWALDEIVEGYHIWVADNGEGVLVYQCTIGETPPQCHTGFYSKRELLRLKGIR